MKENFNLAQKQPKINDALMKVIGNKVKQDLFRSGKFNLSARASLRKKEPKFIPNEPGTTNFTDVKTVGGVKTEAIVPLEDIGSFNFAGTSNQPKGVNIVPDIFIDPVTDKRRKVVGALNVDILKSVTYLVDPNTGNIMHDPGGAIPKDTRGLVQTEFGVIIANEDNERMGIKAGETMLVPFEKVERPLENSGFIKEGDTFVVEGEEVEEGDFGEIFVIE